MSDAVTEPATENEVVDIKRVKRSTEGATEIPDIVKDEENSVVFDDNEEIPATTEAVSIVKRSIESGEQNVPSVNLIDIVTGPVTAQKIEFGPAVYGVESQTEEYAVVNDEIEATTVVTARRGIVKRDVDEATTSATGQDEEILQDSENEVENDDFKYPTTPYPDSEDSERIPFVQVDPIPAEMIRELDGHRIVVGGNRSCCKF